MNDALRDLSDALSKAIAHEGPLDIAAVCQLSDQMEFLRIRTLRGYERDESWRAAAGALKLAARLEQLPETSAAFASGEISRQHSAAIADACTPERIDELRGVEPQLVELARNRKPNEVRALVCYLADALDGGGAANDEAQLARRRVHASTTIDGMVMSDAVLDPEGDEIYLTALRAEEERDRPEEDTRTPAMRRADAVNVGRLSTATLRRIACDCSISRVITDGPSAVLDVGRTTRTVSPAMRRALIARDRHCRANGCDRGPGWCDAHHTVPWQDGGPTSLDN